MTLPYHTPLTDAQQRQLGLDHPQPFAVADRVRFAELDALNHVNNKAYLEWFETVRVAYFKQLCAHHYEGRPAPRMVIRNADIHYVQEMVMDEDYVVTVRVTGYRTTSFVMEHQLWSGGSLRARMTGVMVTLLPDGSGRYPLPEALVAEFRERDGAQPA
ncbi:acyl-CoA thioester hydrolase [Cribrihabitans marinus]|uniref:Acyl-CoA thioester hydrolase n=1 Tax=Cribrihabitans marinus TaxID=1227549 RepID=A0A1H6VVR4_9RHOB|nr:thioesterase family protein [Cribrihabitans marinus]GGH25072.1 hypothetical protein GCM10010973_11990 [Cribrihabitans marinus]SEJ08719.1 acyl-CoA thioester hydrolase [Cribrihabitans marinus]